MTFENVKSITLTILVIISGMLTWSIWTYQPKYDMMENTEPVPGVSISAQKEIRDIVKPEQIFYHHEDGHYGTVHISEIDRIMREVSRWNFEQFEDATGQVANIANFAYESGRVQIIFPDIIPMEIYKNVLGVKERDVPNIVFDQIIINMNNITKENGYVYFLSTEQQQIIRARVTASFVSNFRDDYYHRAASSRYFTPYSLEAVTDVRKLLVPATSITMGANNYLLDMIPTTDFRDALFRNPSFVKRSSTRYGDEYKNSTTLLSANYETNTILYVDPTQERGLVTKSSALLQRSIDFVNSHGGWTDNYLYVGLDEFEQTVLFRLYDSSGYPIFNNNGMSEILQIWGETGIYQYLRNNFSIDRKVETTEEIELMSGIKVLELLKNREGIEAEFLQDLRPGYEMTRVAGSPLIRLEPSWYYKYKDQWWSVRSGMEGGLEYGLE